MPIELLLIGAGGHAKVVIEAFKLQTENYHIIVADQDSSKEGQTILGEYSIRQLVDWGNFPSQYHVAIGNNKIRQQINVEAIEKGKQPVTVIHPEASISSSARLEPGNFVAAKAIVSTEAVVNKGCIINHGAIVDHDCQIGDYTHIAPNATLGGGVIVGLGCLIGAGATILPLVNIGSQVIVGAGAVVTSDIPDNQTVLGIPGKCVMTDA